MKYTLSLIIIAIMLYACKSQKLPTDVSNNDLENPPCTLQISNNLYIDETEITNQYYTDYLTWTAWTFGWNSYEYLSIKPDPTVWSKLDSNYAYLDDDYLYNPYYSDFPVVGLSFEQALKYSKWRSDQAMENILHKMDLIQVVPFPSKDSVFTIEKYYTGQYFGGQPDSNFLYYLHYFLPDTSNFELANLFADSLNTINYKRCHRKFQADNFSPDGHCLGEERKDADNWKYESAPTVITRCYSCKRELITHLRGNVREMTNIEGVFYGNSFIDSCITPSNIYRLDSSLVNCYTGFRLACEFRKWGN